MILKDHKRPDGREITQIRPLAAEVDIIPRVHGGMAQLVYSCFGLPHSATILSMNAMMVWLISWAL